MNVKQLKALRKNQHELMQSMRGQLDEHAYRRLKDHLSSVVQLIKDTHNTTEERLLAENNSLKSQAAERETQHEAELTRLRQNCLKELAAKQSAVEARYRKRTEQMEATVARLQHVDALMRRRLLQLNEIACTTKALNAAKCQFHDDVVLRMLRLAMDATALCVDKEKNLRLSWTGFDVVPYLTDNGWNVFICCQGELSTMPAVITVREHARKRALS